MYEIAYCAPKESAGCIAKVWFKNGCMDTYVTVMTLRKRAELRINFGGLAA